MTVDPHKAKAIFLEAIEHHPLREQHTILIDDWDLVESETRCPHLTPMGVREALYRINPRFRLSRVDGLLHEKREPCFLVMVAEPPESEKKI